MADALNHRLQAEHAAGDTLTVAGARKHRIGAGDLILTRRDDPTIALSAIHCDTGQPDGVYEQRWRVAGIDAATNRVAAERSGDGARSVFYGDFVRGHLTLGYAVTVHSAHAVTTDTTHAPRPRDQHRLPL